MKRKFLALFLLLSLLTGCCRAEAVPPPVVTAAEVLTLDRGRTLTGYYTREEKLRRVLYCLRCQPRRGEASASPAQMAGTRTLIRLTLSDGSVRTCRIRCGRYLSVDGHRWQALGGENRRLAYLLRLMPSDPVAKMPGG